MVLTVIAIISINLGLAVVILVSKKKDQAVKVMANAKIGRNSGSSRKMV